MKQSIPTFIINLKERRDRYVHTMKEFDNKDEFSVTIVEAIKHEDGAFGLISTIRMIMNTLIPKDAPYIIIGEDDHQFTEDYSKELLFSAIQNAEQFNADLLIGGISSFKGCMPVGPNLMWLRLFTGTQFIIIFRKFFPKIIHAKIEIGEVADNLYASLTDSKYFIYPFISTQREFGYSDVTSSNNKVGRVKDLFQKSIENAHLLNQVYSFYHRVCPNQHVQELDFANMILPTYIINLPEREDRRIHILRQFEDKSEFDCTLVNAIKHSIGAYGLWLTIRKIIGLAIDNEDDVILICEDDHEFSADYNRAFLFKNILEAHYQGADYISGGSGGFDFAIPITENRFWVNPCYSTQFTIVYRKFFQKILDEPFDEDVIADILLPSMTSNKMLLFPFISFQKDFGYSDVTVIHHDSKGLITQLFKNSVTVLATHQEVYIRHLKQKVINSSIT